MNKPLSPARTHKVVREAFLAAAGETSASAASFVDQVLADIVPDETPELGPEDLAANLADFWAYAARRKSGQASLRLVPALGPDGLRLDRLEIVQDDCPFLVDSIMGEIAEHGLSVRAMFHPMVEVGRDRKGERTEGGKLHRESMIQVILGPIGADREAALLVGLKATLADVRAAVDDFQAMLALMGKTSADLQLNHGGGSPRAEDIEFLGWLQAGHFVFLGARVYEYPRTADGEYAADEPLYKPTDGLGVLRDPGRTVLRRTNEPALLTAQVRHRLASDPALTVAKSNVRSRVHRRVYMDYVGVKHYGADGKPAGEVRFVGLFTADAYDQPVETVPLIRAKVAGALAKAGTAPGSHNEKRLKTIAENYPRDELFQMTEDELLRISLGVLHLADRPRVKLFERIDPFDRFASVLLFVPRERYDSDLRARAGEILAKAYGGRLSAYYPSFSDSPLARVHYIIGFTPGDHQKLDLKQVEAQIAEATRTWGDRFDAAVRTSDREPSDVADTLSLYRNAFSAGYRERYDAAEALADIAVIDALAPEEAAHARAFRRPGDLATEFRFKLYKPGGPAPLADVLPILESMGLKTMVEDGYPIRPAGRQPIWVHEFEIFDERGEHLKFEAIHHAFEDTVVAVWNGKAENDGFNRLVLELGVSWRDAALVRALARHRQQSGLDPSQKVQEEALAANPEVTRLILQLFRTKFDPALTIDLKARQEQAQTVQAEIVEALQAVESLDHDRVLRRMALLIGAAKRTNFYQVDEAGQPKPYISFKVASTELADLPLPKPYREIFVWSPQVEGVHLRFGPIARGGLRWSDRRDDFRTEVLGLAKAQQVKNAVIVPVGAKGGFYPKQLPKTGADQIRAEGVKAYKTFLNGLLDITDNLTPEGKVVTPPAVIAHEADDPYLVVAADKGTATFSDIANGEAERYGFWLGDAFASGGSVGYDHKAMGITARGAWEAVKRHFRELGKDIQSEPFTVIGVGDMSGDVFGNGMLLSKQTRLVVAFDHRHIFFDPDPDPAVSWDERARLFALPRSSWDDYDKTKISKGGGVFPRSLKSVPLSQEVRNLLQIGAEALTPTELISAILKAPAELLYLGGVGTYVKALGQSNADVGDKANDSLRVNGRDLRVQVVGEGANLGFTQAGRIEFALAGGRIDTDAIDNSAGVDCSDHEVNIKILTGMLERTGQLTRKRRDALLKQMTDEVADHVLAHNYDQTLALSLEQMDAVGELQPHAQFMIELEEVGRLDRAVEGLPDNAAIAERAKAGQGLTRPELAVLVAYGKLELSRDIVESSAPEDAYFEPVVANYFPKPLRKYGETIQKHRLRNEIIATVVANDLVNRCGPSFPTRLMSAAACNTAALVTGYEAAKAVFDIPALWKATAALDGKIAAQGQMALFRRLAGALRAGTYWLARRAARENLSVDGLIARYAHGVQSLRKLTPEILAPVDAEAYEKRAASLIEVGAPETLAREAAALASLSTAADLVDLAESSSWPLPAVARLYHQVGAFFGFDRLRVAAGGFTAGDSFERTAVRRLIEDLLEEQAELTRAVIAFSGDHQAAHKNEAARSAIASWVSLRRDLAKRARDTITEIETAGGEWSFAKLTIANAALRELATKQQARKKR